MISKRRQRSSLSEAVMPEDLVLQAAARHQVREEEQRRRRPLGRFLAGRGKSVGGFLPQRFFSTKDISKESTSTQESGETVIPSFRPYDWRKEHLPLILKLQREQQNLERQERDGEPLDTGMTERLCPSMKAVVDEKTKALQEQLANNTEDDSGSTWNDSSREIEADSTSTTATRHKAKIVHVSSTASLTSLLGEDEPSRRTISSIAA